MLAKSPVTESAERLRAKVVRIALEWEQTFGAPPQITTAISEYDAARLIRHTTAAFAGLTASCPRSRGWP
jgi:hypothetical protein